MKVTDERLDVTIERSGMMKTSAETTMKVLRDGVRVVRLNLYPTLRVSGVYSESGAPLDFVQEAKRTRSGLCGYPAGCGEGGRYRARADGVRRQGRGAQRWE